MNATTRTARQHLTSRHNLRQRHYAALSERGQRIVEQGKRSQVELTPPTAQTSVEWEWGMEKGNYGH